MPPRRTGRCRRDPRRHRFNSGRGSGHERGCRHTDRDRCVVGAAARRDGRSSAAWADARAHLSQPQSRHGGRDAHPGPPTRRRGGRLHGARPYQGREPHRAARRGAPAHVRRVLAPHIPSGSDGGDDRSARILSSRAVGAATLRLLVTDPVLDPARQEPEFAEYIWTGTTEVSAAESARGSATAAPRVVVSFSSTPLPGMRRAYRNAIEALGDLPVEAIVTTGGFDLGDTAPAARNVQIHGYVPHAEVLPGAALVIGHGGHSTTMKALSHGIPLLVMPLNPTADQGLIGDVVEQSGLGRRISARSNPATIRREVADLLQNHPVRERAQATAARLRSAPPGAEVAADRILRAARS
jgi:Glycosyltransferase family 28 C-terminal domain